ncbi:GGDEF domain-containing protein [Mobilibacterium timonense]|uniref:GGDEF domain-containing protein n=1 Tax=Mobilibacterium timonense TaxID=1871012 RepID=UPI003A9217F9
MKKTDRIKTLQLFIFLLISVLSIIVIVILGKGDRNAVLLLWLTLAVSFFFIFVDFTLFADQQKAYEKMLETIGSDPVSKIANRYSIDALLDKYEGRSLPSSFTCIAFEITNIKEINRKYGRAGGNEALKRFSITLNLASLDSFFVGRNGGNRFIAMSEDLSRDDVAVFLQRISDKIDQYNSQASSPHIRYTIGAAFNDGEKGRDIVDLIALSNRRIRETEEIHNIVKTHPAPLSDSKDDEDHE